MKIITLLFILLLPSLLHSEDFWKLSQGIQSLIGINSLAVDSRNNLYAATNNQIFKSSDSGLNWIKIKSLPDSLSLSSDIITDKSGNLFIHAAITYGN